MKDDNAQSLLTKVMDWDSDDGMEKVQILQLLAYYKYDHYQRFGPGKRFIESLSLWLHQFDQSDRNAALDFVLNNLIYFSDLEISHLVEHGYKDVIVKERLRLVAEEKNISTYRVKEISTDKRFLELKHKSLYLGLSDGARTNEIRRASGGEINNEQIWQAYELSDEKAEDMLAKLHETLMDDNRIENISNEDIVSACISKNKVEAFDLIDKIRNKSNTKISNSKFNLIWLLDDFSGSGYSYIRFDSKTGKYKGKIKKIYERLHQGDLIDTNNYEVFLLLYIATRQAIDHIEYWSERFTSENGYKPLQVRVLFPIEREMSIQKNQFPELDTIIHNPKYYDKSVFDKHMTVGGTNDASMGFAGCALPVVMSHNTPNNSLYILWGPEGTNFFGLFPRVSRHKES